MMPSGDSAALRPAETRSPDEACALIALPDRDRGLTRLLATCPVRLDAEQVTTIAEEIQISPPDALSAQRLATLIAALASPVFRDVLLIQWATDEETGSRACALQLRCEAGDPVEMPAHLVRVLLGHGDEPEPRRLAAALAACRFAAAHAPAAESAAAALTACAWLSWAAGSSADARGYLASAASADAGRPRVRVIDALVHARMVPHWRGPQP